MMKKVLLACAVTSMLALSASASASEFTINPMVGVSNNKAFGSNVALGLEAGYQDIIFGYTYTGDKDESNWSASSEDRNVVPFADMTMINATAYTKESFKAHSVYVGYQFAMRGGHIAVKAGAEFSKYKQNAGLALTESMPGAENSVGFDAYSNSNNVVKPMVGVGYYMDNGLNFNLHYTFHSGDRDMKGEAKFFGLPGAKETLNYSVADKDFSTVMFTVGYRF